MKLLHAKQYAMAEQFEDRAPQLDDEERRSIIRSIEPGTPSLENSVFVMLGAIATVVTFLYGLGLL